MKVTFEKYSSLLELHHDSHFEHAIVLLLLLLRLLSVICGCLRLQE